MATPQAKRITNLKPIEPLTSFERKIYTTNRAGVTTLQRFTAVIAPVRGTPTVIGYYRSSNRYYQLRDRQGAIVWSDEAGIEPSLISPIDLIGPGLVRVAAKGVGLAARGLAGAIRKGISINLPASIGMTTVRGVGRRALGRLALALRKMKEVAARLLFSATVKGPYGKVSRKVLEKAMQSSGPTVSVATRLTSKPAAGRALSVAFGDNAAEVAAAARAVGTTFTASIPKKLIVELERIGLVREVAVRMGGVVGKEYQFLAAASEFIVSFFK